MRTVEFEKIVAAVAEMAEKSAYELPADVLGAIEAAGEAETNPKAKRILGQLLENARIAKEERIPLCQDTGLAIVFVEQGAEVIVDASQGTIVDAINAGVSEGYEEAYLRKSVVGEPLDVRKNTGTNTPAIVHHFVVSGDKIKIGFMAKGGGCENKSQFKMFKPTVDKQEVVDWVVDVVRQAGADACPPFVVGVGMGGNFELSCLLSKKSLLKKIGEPNSDKFYAELESEILEKINALGVGAQGLGGDTTALSVHIEKAPCHIASLPVAVNIECHSHRHKSIVI